MGTLDNFIGNLADRMRMQWERVYEEAIRAEIDKSINKEVRVIEEGMFCYEPIRGLGYMVDWLNKIVSWYILEKKGIKGEWKVVKLEPDEKTGRLKFVMPFLQVSN